MAIYYPPATPEWDNGSMMINLGSTWIWDQKKTNPNDAMKTKTLQTKYLDMENRPPQKIASYMEVS